jgi:hypothetical protein
MTTPITIDNKTTFVSDTLDQLSRRYYNLLHEPIPEDPQLMAELFAILAEDFMQWAGPESIIALAAQKQSEKWRKTPPPCPQEGPGEAQNEPIGNLANL